MADPRAHAYNMGYLDRWRGEGEIGGEGGGGGGRGGYNVRMPHAGEKSATPQRHTTTPHHNAYHTGQVPDGVVEYMVFYVTNWF